MAYSDLLKDPRWQKKRLEVLSRDDFTCQNCSSSVNTLHVHHVYYEHGRKPWEYPIESLITMCSDCHDTEESTLKEIAPQLLQSFRKIGFNTQDLKEIIEALNNCEYNSVFAPALANLFESDTLKEVIKDAFFSELRK